MGAAGVKVYDKFSRVLRVETTVNDLSFFKHHRKVEHKDRHVTRELAPLKKTIYSLIDLREILLSANATQPIWITELGYTIQPGLHPHVSADDQANYLLGSFERVRAKWPWVEMFTVWNLSYTGGDEEMQGFSIINPDRTPRLAFQRIADMRQQLEQSR